MKSLKSSCSHHRHGPGHHCSAQAILDVFVWLPNGVGLVLSLAQLLLRFLYPDRAKEPLLVDHTHHA